MRILLIAGDAAIGDSVRRRLQLENFTVDWAQDQRSAELALAHGVYGTLVLDFDLPNRGALQILKEHARRARGQAVLIITEASAVAERIDALHHGAEDYLVKPFDLNELVARVRALMRRHTVRSDGTSKADGSAIRLDPITHCVEIEQRRIDVSAKEFALLQALMQTPGAVLSREELEDRIYGWQEEIGSNAIEVHIHNVRKKLGQSIIRNVRGVGYKIGEPPRAGAALNAA